mmetsp:Transcript_38095/g.76342  ORF Transcript_38095/g.76342 Transcript_38095/m.76342 type:complete len:166 (+) Transcript_38095:207-704(+)
MRTRHSLPGGLAQCKTKDTTHRRHLSMGSLTLEQCLGCRGRAAPGRREYGTLSYPQLVYTAVPHPLDRGSIFPLLGTCACLHATPLHMHMLRRAHGSAHGTPHATCPVGVIGAVACPYGTPFSDDTATSSTEDCMGNVLTIGRKERERVSVVPNRRTPSPPKKHW